MASTAVRVSFCDYCHQKPKFVGHSFCSKTCATQAATTLCVQCHQKPRFANYDFCGKHCAQTALAQKPTLTRQQPAPQVRFQAPQAPAGKGATHGKSYQRAVPAPAAVPQPQMQAPAPAPAKKNHGSSWVKNAAAQLPQILANANLNNLGPQVAPVAKAAQQLHQVATTVLAQQSQQPQQPQLTVQTNVAAPACIPTSPAKCLLPGCDEEAYVDTDGQQTSDYCSMSHREEAVQSGLVSPCIMCLTMPQSKVDHFCGRACREEALSKPL